MTATAVLGRGIVAPLRWARLPHWFDGIVYLMLLALMVAVAFGGALAPYDPYHVDLPSALLPPSPEHLMGTDENGRDIWSRILTGAAGTLWSAFLIAVVAAFIGVAAAALAASLGRWVDESIMRLCDILLAVPSLVLALGIAIALGPSLESAAIAMIIASWPGTTRVVRGVFRTTMSQSYVESARAMGASRTRVMLQHVIPNSLDVVIVQTAFDIGGLTLLLAGLSYIGVGAQPPSAEWGAMASAGGAYALTSWWVALWPGLAITFAVVTFGLMGEILQARLNPMLRRK
jgi:peptide/nickel transport system permease protein